MFELSDSYRREAVRRLQLCARLRRFHLPELHIHTRNMPAAVELSVALNEIIVAQISEVADEWQLLISATHEFARSHEQYLRTLAATVRMPLLLKVYPPGRLCQDGVEIDVEYKVSDANGCPREFSTFQIDERITRSFGLRCRGQTRSEKGMATIHGVLTSSVERYLYFAFDRIARLEAAAIVSHYRCGYAQPLFVLFLLARALCQGRLTLLINLRAAACAPIWTIGPARSRGRSNEPTTS